MPPPMFSVKSNVKQFSRGLSSIQRRQIPFATARALNDTIFGVRKRIVGRTWPRAVTVRNRRFMSTALRVEKATKRKQQVALFDRFGRDFLPLQAEGGIKRPRGAHIAVPIQRNVRRTASGKVRKSQLPRVVLRKPKVFTGRIRSAHPAIAERTRKGGLKLLYTLIRSAPIAKRFMFYEDAAASSARQFPRHLARRFTQALRTAR